MSAHFKRILMAAVALLVALTAPSGNAATAETLRPASANPARQLEEQFVQVANRVGPAVVSISTEVTERLPARRFRFEGSPFSDSDEDIFDRFFRDFFGEMPEREFKQRGLGTGVILDEEGYLLTNEHVIHGADRVTVTLPDGREFKGEIKGSDLRSDLAVIKIPAHNLPIAELGDSDQVKIGQWAIAVGNPFGFAVGGNEPTLTVGVISAVNRSLRVGGSDRDYSGLIQTDAAINPGNSGGPLANLDGQVIGVNVAIFSTTGGYQGIGFAIPSNRAKAILTDLIQGKKILYGWLGVNVQDVTEDLAKHFGLDSRQGVIVAKVLAGSPGAKSGLQEGDVIRAFDGEPLKDVRDLLKRVSLSRVGQKVGLSVVREKRPITVVVEIGERPSESKAAEEAQGEKSWRGLAVGPITPALKDRFQLGDKAGVVVMGVEPGSPADEAGLRPGDIIQGLNRRPIASLNDFKRVSQGIRGDALVKTTRGYAVIRGES